MSPGLSQFGLSAIADGEEPTLLAGGPFTNGNLLYASKAPGYSGGAEPMVVHSRSDGFVSVIDPATAPYTDFDETRMAMDGADILMVAGPSSGIPIYRYNPAAGTWTTEITGANNASVWAMRRTDDGKLVTVSTGFAQARRFNADGSIDTTVSLSGYASVATQGVAIDPGGDYIYGYGIEGLTAPNTALRLWRWSITGGGGAPTLVATRTITGDSFDIFGDGGIAVQADGGVVIAIGEVTGTGNFLSDPYIHKFWVHRFIVGTVSYDVTSYVPDPETNQFNPRTSPSMQLQVPWSNMITTDAYQGGENVWFVLHHLIPSVSPDPDYLVGINMATGVGFVNHIHPADNSDQNQLSTSASDLLVYSGTPLYPGLARYPSKDAAETWGPELVGAAE